MQSDRFLLFDAVTRAMAELGNAGGVVVVLDDLHRADEASLALLRFLVSSLHDMSILVIGTYRDTELAVDDVTRRDT